MNSNESKKLSPKQKELVKRLEEIRRNKNNTKEDSKETTKKGQPRNKNMQQERNKSKQKKKSFARPTEERTQRKETPSYASNRRMKTNEPKKNQTVTKRKEKSKDLINQLSKGNSLSQAIVLSEILGKPVSLRRK